MKLIPVSATFLAAVLTLVATASAQVPVLPAPPIGGGLAASTIFDAMLAIARAAASNPAAATQASFSYNAAVQQFNAKDFARSRQSALDAISQTAAVPLPQPSLVPPPIPQPSHYLMPSVPGSHEADGESYVALARRAQTACGAPGAAPSATVAQQYTAAVDALAARNYNAALALSQGIIDQCAAATQAYATQQAALPQPSPTPMPMPSYTPLPLASYIPDPALQTAPVVMPTAAPTAAPAPRRGLRLFGL